MILIDNFLLKFNAAICVVAIFLLASCEAEDPVREDTPEMITKVVLTFQPDSGNAIVVSAIDPDGDGLRSMQADTIAHLGAGMHYVLHISMFNEFAQPDDADYNISAEVEEESDEHMIFFEWSKSIFGEPAGNGNVDNRNDVVNYLDQDEYGLPLGLETDWKTGMPSAGSIRILLKHQPELKSAASQSSEGETDLDVTFDIVID